MLVAAAQSAMKATLMVIVVQTRNPIGPQIWSWVVVGAVVVLGLGTGVAFTTSGHPWIADACYVFSAALFVAKFFTWEDVRQQELTRRRRANSVAAGAATIILALIISGNHYLNLSAKSATPNLASQTNNATQEKPKSEIASKQPPTTQSGTADSTNESKQPGKNQTSDSNPTSNTPAPSTANIPAKTKPVKTKSRPKEPETERAPSVSSSGTDSPAIGSITQGPGSALSINQQGGITAGTVNNFGPLLLPTATVTICATYPDVVAGEDFHSVVTFTTSSQLPRPWFALFFDGPVLDGSVGRVKGSYGYTHGRAEKLPNPENSFIFRTIAMELGGTSSWFPADGPIRATVSSKSRVKLIKVMAGGGDDPDMALPVNLAFSCS